MPETASRSTPVEFSLGVLCDFRQEGWPSMDLVAEMLLREMPPFVRAVRVAPPWRALLSAQQPGKFRLAFNADRMLNRLVHYPSFLRRKRSSFEFAHICDHSYAQLIEELEAHRTGVFCHDLDAFQSALVPEDKPRSRWLRWWSRRLVDGIKRARLVFCSTSIMRQQLVANNLAPADRIVVVPYGVAAEFGPDKKPDDAIIVREFAGAQPYLLHVGSCIRRKRIDVLLDVFASLAVRQREIRLLQLGGTWSNEQERQIRRLGMSDRVNQRRGLSRRELAALYRHATAVLLTSDSEGFGLPVLEALASGTRVVASDLPVLREITWGHALLCPVAAIGAWTNAVNSLIAQADSELARQQRAEFARTFTWQAHAARIAESYRDLARGGS